MCLSEFQAAVLLDRLSHLDEENRIREQNGAYLRALLLDIGGITPLSRHPETEALTYYQFCVRLNPAAFGGISVETIAQAVTAELDVLVEPVDSPLNDNLLYNPLRSPRTNSGMAENLNPKRYNLPVATKARQECLTFPHKVLLGGRGDMEDIAAAFAKVKYHHDVLCKINRK
jgi:dTDP-4-amino-4,6-dideoxygalactose transaminase